jgi:hypothetical protein
MSASPLSLFPSAVWTQSFSSVPPFFRTCCDVCKRVTALFVVPSKNCEVTFIQQPTTKISSPQRWNNLQLSEVLSFSSSPLFLACVCVCVMQMCRFLGGLLAVQRSPGNHFRFELHENDSLWESLPFDRNRVRCDSCRLSF